VVTASKMSSEQTWSYFEAIGPGIHLYHDVLPEEMGIIETLEDYLFDNEDNAGWLEALVGYQEKIPDYRDCYDFKFKTSRYRKKEKTKTAQAMCDMYDATYFRQLQVVNHYCSTYNIADLRYWESTNFVKYGPGQHFAEHTDHGYSYNCTVSLIGYPNDDYEGGELEFGFWGIKFKPRLGDLIVFPSNYMYPHRTLPVTSGIKYSLVTMLDYSEKFHSPGMYHETGN
jgi:hypothetical protein